LGEPGHPAILRFLKLTIDAAHKKGISAAMCGELAGDARSTAVLTGMGLDEFSMSASSIPLIKKIVRGTTLKSCQDLAEKVLRGASIKENDDTVQAWMSENFPPEENGI
jgi:phosphotransferase system enzyme I (PtsI)